MPLSNANFSSQIDQIGLQIPRWLASAHYCNINCLARYALLLWVKCGHSSGWQVLWLGHLHSATSYIERIEPFAFCHFSHGVCLYITITILLWVLSIYPFIKHYTIVVSIITIQFSHMEPFAFCHFSHGAICILLLLPWHHLHSATSHIEHN